MLRRPDYYKIAYPLHPPDGIAYKARLPPPRQEKIKSLTGKGWPMAAAPPHIEFHLLF